MTCPTCGLPGRKAFGGYCTKVHLKLSKGPRVRVLECARCGAPVARTSSRISKGGNVFCPRCPKNSGGTHPRWKEGQYFNKAGYRLELVNGEYKLSHRHTWEEANRSCILPEAHGILSIHHINMVKADNRPENLVMLTNREHGRLHRWIDVGKYEEAKGILLNRCAEQVFWVENPLHLEHLAKTPLESILNREN